MSDYSEINKYILKKVISKKSLKQDSSTPSGCPTDYEQTSSSGLKDSCSGLQKKIADLQITNEKLRSQLARMKYVQEELNECKRQIEQLEIEKDFYMRAYKTLKKQSGQLIKQSINREKSVKELRLSSRQKAFTGYESGQTYISVTSRKDMQPSRESSRYKRMLVDEKPDGMKERLSPSYKARLIPSSPSRKINSQQQIYLQDQLSPRQKSRPQYFTKQSSHQHPYGFLSKSKQKYRFRTGRQQNS